VASLLACSKPEEASAPTASQAEVETPQVAPVPVAAPEPVAPPVESASAPQAAAAPATAKPAEPQAAPASAAKPDLAHGQQIYRQACAFCHDKGIAGAPKTGDAAAWTPRLAQGMDGVYASALRGKGAMPAKGGNPSLADADVKAAVDYLAAQSR
jgi:cytochrome c5